MTDAPTAVRTDHDPEALRQLYQSVDGTCLRRGENLSFFMNPPRYFSRVREHLDDKVIFHQLQNTFRNICQSYLNGYGENAFARPIKYLIQLLATDEFRTEPAVDEFLDRLDLQQLASVDHVDLDVVERAIEVVFPVLRNEIDSRSDESSRATTLPRAVYPETTRLDDHPPVEATYRRLSEQTAAIEPLLSTVLIHGSLSTLDYTPYSDVDTMIFVDDRVFGSRGLLRTCRKALTQAAAPMFEYDPLQHHRFFISPAVNLRYYPESYLPRAVISEATTLLGHRELEITTRPSRREVLRSLWALCSDFRVWFLSGKHPSKPFDLKRYTSRLMILPTLMLEAFHDEYLYKRDSFARARTHFSPDAWQSIEIATRIRDTWQFGKRYQVSPTFFKSTFVLAEEILRQMQTLKETDSDFQIYDVN
jgi:hypothetical protein